MLNTGDRGQTIKLGPAEAVSMAAISLCVNGIFSPDPSLLYAEDGRAYIAAPIAVLFALTVLLLIVRVMRDTGCGNAAELFRRAAGGASILFALPIVCALLLCAVAPFFTLTQVLQRLVFDGVNFINILAFILPVTAYMAIKGTECVGRTAKCFILLLLAAFAVSFVSAAQGFDASRLCPQPVGGMGSLGSAAALTAFVLPPLLGLTICGGFLQGAAYIRRSGINAALTAVVVCTAAQLAVSLCFPRTELTDILAPIFRMGLLSPKQSFVLRLDKLFIMIWLTGAMISGAYCVRSAALLVTGTLKTKGEVFVSAGFILAVGILLLCGESLNPREIESIRERISEWGGAAIMAPILVSLAICTARRNAKFIRRRAKK